MVKPNSYEPIDTELSPAHALVQSANMLDRASLHAIRCDDFDSMMTAARGWAELSQIIGSVAEAAQELDITTETEVLGFRSEEEREEYEDRARRRKESK